MPVPHTFSLPSPARFIAEQPVSGADKVNAASNGCPRSTYWPVGPLQAFTLCMASHGLCVSSAMMLGDRPYAMAQLARAHALNDDGLRELAVLLFQQLETRH